jgi:hypothetical protein
MANDHHQSAFDDEQFDRYDTFDDPVVGDADALRNMGFGDLGRLIDKIRIDNAASKLDDNVAVGEDRALNGTGNWAAVPHEELYASVHENNNPAEAYSLAREWTQLGNMMAENSRVMDETIRSTESGWTGPAAEVARQATLKLATWGGDAAQTSQYMGTRIADQGLAAERAKTAMPEPKNFDYEKMLRDGFTTGGLAGLSQAVVDVQAASAQARSSHDQAAQVMAQMEAESKNVDQTTPRFVRPPEVTQGSTVDPRVDGLMRGQELMPAQRMNGLRRTQSDQVTPSGFESGALAASSGAPGVPGGVPAGGIPGVPGSTTPSFAGAPGGVPGGVPGGGSFGGQGTPDFASMVPGATGGPGGQSALRGQSYTPPNMTVPDIPNGSTFTSGYNPNIPSSAGGGHLGGTSFRSPTGSFDPSTMLPPGITTGRGSGDTTRGNYPPGYSPSKIPGGINPITGMPYTPEEIRSGRGMPGLRGGMPGMPGGGGGGGMPSGFGGGAGGVGGGAGGGFGRGGIPGMGGSMGAVAAAEQAAARSASGMLSGQNGAPGQPGGGAPGMGAGKGNGDDDKEHKNKYASNEKIFDEPGRMVPSVIGEKPAKQLKEEQGS